MEGNISFFYAGFNTTALFPKNGITSIYAIDTFTKFPIPEVTDFQIGWSYFLWWHKENLYISKTTKENGKDEYSSQMIEIPEKKCISWKQAALGSDNIIILAKNHEIWRYKIYSDSWKKIINFITNDSNSEKEYPVKIIQGRHTVVLTNLGRAYNVPTLVNMPKCVKFIDAASGSDHTLFLAENGNIYTMGMGTRGQLGHNDLEDCDNPRLVEALAGIKVVQISAAGWHSTAVTKDGDLYTWGWNKHGELGLLNQRSEVVAVPTLVNFTDGSTEIETEVCVKKAECGVTFTLCLTKDGTIWGSGSNKYGQLGQSRESFPSTSKFVKLDVPMNRENIKDIICREYGSAIVVN